MYRGLRLTGALQKPLELFEFIRLVKTRELNAVMEIGTWDGGTLLAWSQLAAPRARLVSLDLNPRGNDDQLIQRFQAFIQPTQTLKCVRMNSHSDEALNAVTEALDGHKLDFLFIDGDHTYDGVRQDFEMYRSFVRPGGMIAFHDIVFNPHHPGYGVERFWGELRNEYKTHELIDNRYHLPGGGVGVLEWPG